MMETRQKILPAVCCIALLSACASNQSVSIAPWMITPITTTSNTNDKPEAMYQMGRYYQGQNRYNLAIEAYQKVLVIDSGFVEARNGLGVIYSRQGKYREAIEAFLTAVQQEPKAAHIYSNLGYAYYLQGQYSESVAALQHATALDPANQRALNNLGLAYAKAGSKGESVKVFAQAVNVSAVATDAPVATTEAPLQNASSLSVVDAPVNAAPSAETNVAPASQLVVQRSEAQILVLPKDRGVIRPASAAPTVPVVDSRVKLVQLAPNVYELHTQQYSAEPMQVASAADVPSAVKVRVEVANGNGVIGMAGKVGQFLRSQGYPVARLTNQKPFQVRMTQIQYRDGHLAEAQLLKSSLPEVPELVQRNDMRADIGVRLVLGKDVATRTAYFDGKLGRFQLALK
jgi:Tfp pilus assembly protein PilF